MNALETAVLRNPCPVAHQIPCNLVCVLTRIQHKNRFPVRTQPLSVLRSTAAQLTTRAAIPHTALKHMRNKKAPRHCLEAFSRSSGIG